MNPRLLRLFASLAALACLAGAGPGRAGSDEPPRRILVMIRLAPPHFRPSAGYGGSYGDAMAAKARERIARSVARQAGLTLVEGWPMPLIGVDCYVMDVPSGLSTEAAIALAEKDKRVDWSEPLALYRGRGASPARGDPLLPIEPAAGAWRLTDLHRIATGRGIRVAVVDSRIDVAHPDLSGQFAANEDFVGDGGGPAELHGTGVAGIIAAKAGNGIGIAGIAPDARLMALRACRQSGGEAAATLCDSLSLAKAIHFAIGHGAQIINLSLSGPRGPLIERLIALALGRGASVVAAYDPALPGGGFPASEKGVIAVASAPLRPMPAGLYIAPGRDVPTTQPGGRWYLVSGSSYSAAHVSGLLALVRQERGRPALARSADGAVDACASLGGAEGYCDCRCARGASHGR